MKLIAKKGQVIGNLQVFIMAVVTIAVIIAIGLYVLSSIETTVEQANDPTWTSASDTVTAAGNATGDIIDELGNTPTWIGLLIVVVFASAVLAYFYLRGK